MKFGRLTVVERAEDYISLPSKRKSIMWKCLCDCQKKHEPPQHVIIRGNHLTDGTTKSCGCLAKELSSQRETIDITGEKYGKLTVLSRGNNNKRGQTMWWCQCDCGSKPKLIEKSNLISGSTISCGCHKSEKIHATGRKHNQYDLESFDYGVGYTDKGEQFYFDLDDFKIIKNYYWFITNNGYVSSVTNTDSQIMMHRLVLGLGEHDTTCDVDHIKHTKTDNRKSKLRVVSRSKNCINHSLYSNNKSGCSGVGWKKSNGLWYARLDINKRRMHLGYFDKYEDAVRARLKAEEKYYGEYSYNNSINTDGGKR